MAFLLAQFLVHLFKAISDAGKLRYKPTVSSKMIKHETFNRALN